MAIRDYWIYQKRAAPTPWAIYVVKEYDLRDYTNSIVLDYTFYYEGIPNDDHSLSFVGLHYENVKGYADAIASVVIEYAELTHDDYEQLQSEIYNIIYGDILAKARDRK